MIIKMWIIGGYTHNYQQNSNTCISDVWYSSDGTNWNQATVSVNWSPRTNMTACVYDNKMWIMGGASWHVNGPEYTTTDTNDVWYSTDGINWIEATPSANWQPREYLQSFTYNNKLWIIGGADTANIYSDIWNSDSGVSWNRVANSVSCLARYEYACSVFNNTIWILGGIKQIGGTSNDIWSSSDGESWNLVTNSAEWYQRYLLSSVVFDNKLWVLGGEGSYPHSGQCRDVWYYDGL